MDSAPPKGTQLHFSVICCYVWDYRIQDGALLPPIHSYAEIVLVVNVDLDFISVGI